MGRGLRGRRDEWLNPLEEAFFFFFNISGSKMLEPGSGIYVAGG